MQFDWNPDKNEWLKRERGISFEEIALLLGSGHVWRVSDHWNQKKYPGQKIFFMPIDGYIYLVPYVIEGDTFFLKTAIPSRKATREYRAESEQRNEED